MSVSKRAPILERLFDRRKITRSGCWLYTGSTDGNGYGVIGYQGKHHRVHRLAHELLVGPVPEGKVADHECHNRSKCKGGVTCRHRRCFNPEHVRFVEPSVNNRSGRQGKHFAERTHCPQGHRYTKKNTMISKNGNGIRRSCRTCKRESFQRWYDRQKGR